MKITTMFLALARVTAGGIFAVAVAGTSHAQSLATTITGYAEVKTGATPDRRAFNLSMLGDPLDESRDLQLSSSQGGISSGVSAGARARATASATYGALRASTSTSAGYSQFFYVPGPAEGSLVLAPANTNIYTPLTSAQATVQSTDRLTVTSTSATAGTIVPLVFTLTLDAPRDIAYAADGISRGVDDTTTALYPYVGPTFSGIWTPREPYVPMTSGMSLVIADEENPVPPVVSRVLSSRVNFWHFRTITSDVAVNLAVGKTYRVEVRLDVSSRSDGGTNFLPDSSVAGPWPNDSNRLTNRSLALATTAFARVVIAVADATTSYTTVSGVRYEDVATTTPAATVPGAGRMPAPVLTVSGGRKQRTDKTTHELFGKVAGVVSRVGVRVNASGPFRSATGLGRWRHKVALKPGANRVEVRAEGPGGYSAVQRVVIVRR